MVLPKAFISTSSNVQNAVAGDQFGGLRNLSLGITPISKDGEYGPSSFYPL
jgi:hypothetical protein